MNNQNELFAEAAKQWDLETIYTDLASAKGKRLTPMEKLHLRGLLCGHSPTEIAAKLQKNPKGVETDLCATLYKYVKSLVGKSTEKMGNWQNITEWLQESGYKAKSLNKLPADGLQGTFNITNLIMDKENLTVSIGVYLNLNIPIPPEDLKENSDVEDNE